MKKLLIASKSTSRSGRLTIICAGVLLLAGSMVEASRCQQAQGGPEQTENLDAIVTGVRANVVEGRVRFERDQIPFGLSRGLELRGKDVLETDAGGRAEVLLQPGYILRLGEKTVCRLIAIEPERFKVQLDQGTISFELLKNDFFNSRFFDSAEAYQPITVLTRGAEIVIGKAGIYRINVRADGRTEVVVRDGEALINGQRVKKKRIAGAGEAGIETREFDPAVEDAFDHWCRDRARALVVANRLLRDAPWILARKNGKEAVLDFPRAIAQGNSAFVLSAKLATVNFVDAGVEANHAGTWRDLSIETDLETGDAVRTGPRSRAELLLLPNIYLRLDALSEVRFSELSYDTLKVSLIRGSAILDVVKFDSKHSPQIAIAGSASSFGVIKKGNYRINAGQSGDEIVVRKGNAIIAGVAVGSCRRVVAGVSGQCDENNQDSFDIWSRLRGEGAAWDGRPREERQRRGRSMALGFWYLHLRAGYYTFIPLFSEGFQSPYGGRYSNVFTQSRMSFSRGQRSGRGGESQ